MAQAKGLNVVVELAGSEQKRAATYQKALQYVINKCICEVNIDESSNILEGVNGRTSGEGLLNTGTEGRVH